MYRIIDYGWMLRDPRRIDAYARSLAAAITPQSIVADLGTGIGTFAMLAARAGAARIYAIEASDVIEVAKDNARRNGLADRIRFIRSDVVHAELPERVDVIVSDLTGALPLFEQHLPSIIHAREHFLRPRGVLIPSSDRLLCAPVTSASIHARIVDPWRAIPNLDLSAAERLALNSAHNVTVQPEDLLAPPRTWGSIDYTRVTSPDVRGAVEWPIAAAARVFGFALWFESTFDEGITVGSGPWSPTSIHATMVLPLARPIDVSPGDALRLTIACILSGSRYVTTWHASTPRDAGASQSTFFAEQDAPAGEELLSLPHIPSDKSISPTSTTIADDVLSRRFGDELILLNLRAGTYHLLNETGARVWEALQRGDPVDAIVASIADEYDVAPERAARDVAAVLGSLAAATLVRQGE